MAEQYRHWSAQPAHEATRASRGWWAACALLALAGCGTVTVQNNNADAPAAQATPTPTCSATLHCAP